ncbi:GNAT family N-acetyltransferase [Nitrosopumilus sp.]|uniref:GNAT family N-acetyltransferase n=1 Tax=Nitrosopumilus sp. TaxID=2024843 RepID=UPI00247C3333|nr:GNAT family N-acetyltransferase [Nitrosopumilus sp.]MCV0430591.1 GNAT family N-acetyltransferase [Nitrosopumilus sp.]
MNLKIRDAINSDKNIVLKFCKNTFSWGDYIEHVWDFWISEGHLFLAEKEYPVGICHALYSKDQIWIEGIRVDPSFRRQNIASKLITYAETIGKDKDLSFSYMLIDTENSISLSMANSLMYDIFQTWNFYSLAPKINSINNVTFEKSLNLQLYSHYVKSWRWFPIDRKTMNTLSEKNSIVKSCVAKKNSVAILCDSEHFDKTLIVTLFSHSDESVLDLLSFIQNLGTEKNYERIQILTQEKLPLFDTLEHKISFHLMKKSLD